MLRRTILAFAALALCSIASFARAGGLDLSWNDCGTFGVAQKNFACTSNIGNDILIVSAIAPVPMPHLTGAVAVIEIQTNQPTLSNWWRLDPTGCRKTSANLSTSFLSGPFNCVDIWAGSAPSSFAYLAPSPSGPNRARLTLSTAIPGYVSADDVSEMYLFMFVIDHAKTAGAGACSGCADGACLVLESVLLTQTAGLGDYTLLNPLVRQHALWQGGGGLICPYATPTRNATWGSIKSMYR